MVKRPSLKARIDTALSQQWGRHSVDRVSVDLPTPVSVNALHSHERGIVRNSDQYEAWKKAAGQTLNAQHPGRVIGTYALTLLVNVDSTRGDIGNTEKCVSDLLQEHGVIENDRLAQRIMLEWSEDVEGCRAIVEAWRAPVARGGLTERQAELLGFIRRYVAENGFSPTVQEMADGLGYGTKSYVPRLLAGLNERGFITSLPSRARSVRIVEDRTP